jgi:hypothetical protein
MKRFIVIASITVGIILLLGGVAWLRLPSVVTFLLGRAIGGRIDSGQSTVSWNNGIATIELNDITLSGDVRGTIKKTRLDVRIGRGIYIKYGSVSDFDVAIKKEKPGGRFLPLQVEYAEIVRGRAVYKGQTFTINSIKISNFNTAGQFEFSLDGGVEGFGKIKTHGSGIWRNGRSDVSGTYQIVDFDLSSLFRRYEGHSDSSGLLTYRNGDLGLHGVAGADRFVMRENFLKKPVEVPRVDCAIDIETFGGKIQTKLGRLSFKGTPLRLVFTNTGRRFEALEMASGPLHVEDIQEYVTLSFVKRLPAVMDAVSGGKVTVRDLTYAKPDTFRANLSLENVEAHYKEARFVGISGDLRLDRDKMVLTGLTARLGNSAFSAVSGAVPFSEKKEIGVSGKYKLDLADIAGFTRDRAVRISSGSAEGFAEIRGKKEEDMRMEGGGRLKDAVLSWKNLLLVASGSYTFDNNGINCSPFTVKKDATELQVRGRIARDSTELKIEGHIDALDAGRLCLFPYPLAGSAGVDGRVEGKNGEFSWQGAVNMGALSFDIPGFVKKRVGVPSSATFRLRTRNNDLYVEDLSYALSSVTVHVEGKVDRNLLSNLKVRVDATDLGQVSDLIATNGSTAKGEVRAELEVHDLQYPIVRLPRITGYITAKNGSLALPFLAKPLERMDVVCRLTGDRYELNATSLRAGASAIETARLVVEGAERPRVALMMNAINFNADDIIHETGEPWRIRTIKPGGLLSRMSGEIVLRSRQAQWRGVGLDNFDAKLGFADGKLVLYSGNAGMFGGAAHAAGSADLSGPKPQFRLAGSIDGVSWGEMFRAVKGDAEIMKGRGLVRADLNSEGENAKEIVESLSGRVTANSSDGVIRKWNLLSKVFGLLNLYDLLQGKVNLSEEGLPYTVMSADFNGTKGVFKTRNFLIDSPSMYISGRGAITLPDGTLEGRIAVSPLVTIDKVLGKIPVIRSVLREKKEGFLFVVYNVSGPLRDPNIYSTYVESVGMRAYMILRNLINLPKEVMR